MGVSGGQLCAVSIEGAQGGARGGPLLETLYSSDPLETPKSCSGVSCSASDPVQSGGVGCSASDAEGF